MVDRVLISHWATLSAWNKYGLRFIRIASESNIFFVARSLLIMFHIAEMQI